MFQNQKNIRQETVLVVLILDVMFLILFSKQEHNSVINEHGHGHFSVVFFVFFFFAEIEKINRT